MMGQTETIVLQKFTGATGTCPKCNFSSWVRGGYASMRHITESEESPEHMERTCKRCGYSWKEVCAND